MELFMEGTVPLRDLHANCVIGAKERAFIFLLRILPLDSRILESKLFEFNFTKYATALGALEGDA